MAGSEFSVSGSVFRVQCSGFNVQRSVLAKPFFRWARQLLRSAASIERKRETSAKLRASSALSAEVLT